MGVMHERIMSLIPEKRGGVKEFAEKIGVPANLVSMWRKGDSVSYKNYLPQIARAYNVSVDWLCGNDEKKENLTVSGEVKKLTPDRYGEFLRELPMSELLQLYSEMGDVLKERMQE